MKCKIKSIPAESYFVFFEGNLVDRVDYFQFLDLRVQIKESGEWGWSIEFKQDEEPIPIDRNGNLKSWPLGMFDQIDSYLLKLI